MSTDSLFERQSQKPPVGKWKMIQLRERTQYRAAYLFWQLYLNLTETFERQGIMTSEVFHIIGKEAEIFIHNSLLLLV